MVPETAAVPAARDLDGHVVMPVHRQAGASNRSRFVPAAAWWDDAVLFRNRGFFVNEVACA